MKGSFCLFVLLAGPVSVLASQQIIPAGSMVQCTVSEPKLSSKTEEIGDPVLCQVSHVALYGRSVFPYGSYMVGRFEDYKDPGHFAGKGWMELKFERMVLPPDQVVPVAAKVVYAPKYPVDKQGRIHGTGHTVRDVVEWTIPVLWPIDLLNLPRRGPRPVLKAETRLTLKIMDDLVLPGREQTEASVPYYPPQNPARDSYGFSERTPAYKPQSYMQQYVPPAPPPLDLAYYPPPTPMQALTVLVLRDGNSRLATDYWFDDGMRVRYVALSGRSIVIPMGALDMGRTVEVNRQRGVPFVIRSVGNFAY